jgi:type I restriction enzyme S subunit
MSDNTKHKLGYKRTALGWIPEEWVESTVGDVCEVVNGRGFKPHEWKESGLPIIRIQNLNGSSEFNYFQGKFDPKILVEKGQLLFAWSGSKGTSFGPHLWNGSDGVLNYHTWKLNVKNESIDKAYFQHYLRIITAKIEESAHGASALVHTQKGEMEKFPIPLPPLREQCAIAGVLGCWDKAIGTLTALIAQKQARKKWLMQVLLTGKKRLPGFQGEWKEVFIRDLFIEVRRYAKWNDYDSYKLVSIRRRFGGLFERGEFYGHQIEVKKIKSIHAKDFLISKRQVSHGAWAIVPVEFHDWKVSDEYDCLAIKDEKMLDSEFWKWFCMAPKLRHFAFLASIGIHIEKLIFDYDTFKKRKVKIPSTIHEQAAIAQVISLASKEIEVLNSQLESLQLQKKGLMQELLTGKKRLKHD